MREEVVCGFSRSRCRKARIIKPASWGEAVRAVREADVILPAGNHYSYGDSSLNRILLDMRGLKRILHWDDEQDLLTVEAGMTLAELLPWLLNRGRFYLITPGTKGITLGGAVASNVHGKDHHVHGSFIHSVEALTILHADGSIRTYTKRDRAFTHFFASYGLLGIILTVTLRVKRIPGTRILAEHVKTRNLRETLRILYRMEASLPYTVAWIDTSARGTALGRGIVMGGRFIPGRLPLKRVKRVPFSLPGWVMASERFMRFANRAYYALQPAGRRVESVDSFFYPLDALRDWNRVYGRGFVQYQFSVPRAHAEAAVSRVIKTMQEYHLLSFVSVLKTTGRERLRGVFDFTQPGVSFAVDIPLTNRTGRLVEELDRIILKHAGRVYLTKDSLLTPEVFKRMYSRETARFKRLKKTYDPTHKLVSDQALRLGLIRGERV